jgi:hypothetical protein
MAEPDMKILVVFPYQWGYNSDYLFYCQILAEKYPVTYIGYELGLPAIPAKKVNIIQIKKEGTLKSIYNLYKAIRSELSSGNYTHIFINYFLSASIICRLLGKQNMSILDIRTSFIFKNKTKTYLYNRIMKMEARYFRYITVVSAGVKEFLGLPERTHILPLGGPHFPLISKDINTLRFLYVGTFYDRNIPNTIKAFASFLNSHGTKIKSHYTIVGHGTEIEQAEITDLIQSENLAENVKYVGTVRYPELYSFFADHNIGICYIPLTSYYDCQPPTKTYEYLLSGSIVLGTNTFENRKLINSQNGVLVGDTIEEFYKGMVHIYENRKNYSSTEIQHEAEPYTWDNIVNMNMIKYLLKIKTDNKQNSNLS